MPVGAVCFEEGLQMCAEIYKMLRSILDQYDYPTAVGDEEDSHQIFRIQKKHSG